MRKPPEAIGKAKAVLVFGRGAGALAVVTTVVARLGQSRSRQRLEFSGSVRFTRGVARHMNRIVLATVNEILVQLRLQPRSFDIALVPIGAIAAAGLRTRVSGSSADTAAFLAMLSAAIRLPLRQDVATTGAIDSWVQEIGPVEDLPAKFAAAAADPSIREFFYPFLDSDRSLMTLSPEAFKRVSAAIGEAKQTLLAYEVLGLQPLVDAATTPRARVLAALKSGYYERPIESENHGDSPDSVARFLCTQDRMRFREVLRAQAVAGRTRETKQLLAALAAFSIGRGVYPESLGSDLQSLVAGVPSPIRRRRSFYPLLPEDVCVHLGKLASAEDVDDYEVLRVVAIGKPQQSRVDGMDVRGGSAAESADVEPLVQAVFAEISADNLAQRIDQSIDAARASYSLDRVTFDSDDEVVDCVASFYVHLLCRDGGSLTAAQLDAAKSDSESLLERTFVNEDGVAAAFAEARYGTRGGMRFVLDAVTERLKAEAQSEHVSAILKDALDPLHREAKVAFMEALLRRVRPQLPDDLQDEPPERFVRKLGALASAYVRSLDRFSQIVRSL